MAFCEYCYSECPLFKQGAFWKTVLPECHGFQTGHSTQNALVFKQGAFCPECRGFQTRGHSAQNAMVSKQGAFWKTVLRSQKAMVSKQRAFCTQNAMVSVSSVSLLSKNTFHLGENWYKPVNNVKIPPFPRTLKKMPSLGLQNCPLEKGGILAHYGMLSNLPRSLHAESLAVHNLSVFLHVNWQSTVNCGRQGIFSGSLYSCSLSW